jgi:hypothetical protein
MSNSKQNREEAKVPGLIGKQRFPASPSSDRYELVNLETRQ